MRTFSAVILAILFLLAGYGFERVVAYRIGGSPGQAFAATASRDGHSGDAVREAEGKADLGQHPEGRGSATETLSPSLEAYLESLTDRLILAVQLDLPFLSEERENRMAALRMSLADPDAPLEEKLRHVLETLLIEAQYGSEVVAEAGVIATRQDAEKGMVQGERLRVGRLAEFFLSRDQTRAWTLLRCANDPRGSHWAETDADTTRAVRLALDMLAHRTQAGLVLLPLPTYRDSSATPPRFPSASSTTAVQGPLHISMDSATINVVTNAARDAERLLLRSLGGILYPERIAACRSLLDSDGPPSLPSIQALAEALLAQMRDSGTISQQEAPVLDRNGDQVRAVVLRLGENVAYARTPMGCSGLTILEGGFLSASDATLPDDVLEAANHALQDRDSAALHLPLDFSDGSLFASATREAHFGQWLASGGFLVWPILLVGLAGLLIGLERFVLLLRVRRASSELLLRLEELFRAGKTDECRSLCASIGNSPACRVLGAGLDHTPAPRDVLENVFHNAMLKEVPRLERFLPTLSVLGAIAPLLGLLGTVTGMINTFTAMTLFGNADPKLMSGGISEALITTQLGLSVAIPILLLHHFLELRVDGIVADMEEKSVAFSVTLLGSSEPA